MNNNHYKDHGAAIFCSMGVNEINVNINNCKFSYNGNAKSIIHFDYEAVNHSIYLNTSNFHNNQGISVYLSKKYSLYICAVEMFCLKTM